MPLTIQLAGVRFAYPGGPPVLHDIDLEVESGEFVAIAGPNGGGKTTLLRLVLGLERPQAGSAKLFGEPASRCSRRSRIGYLAQRAQLGIDSPVTVREVVAAGRAPRNGLAGRFGRGDRARVEAAIARVGLEELAGRPTATLSGGQQQRAFIAKALAGEPELLVLDEPTRGVDPKRKDELSALLRSQAEARATLVVTNDLVFASEVADRYVSTVPAREAALA
jgi:zinc transport system ATP-binding protein